MKLSKNFTLKEMLSSPTAARYGYKEQYNPSDDVILNLRILVENLLQPIRDALGCPIVVTSGYRCSRLNNKVKGSKTSQHVTGQAADINNSCGSDIELAKIVIREGLNFDQMILEFGSISNPRWIHVSLTSVYNRKQILRAYKVGRRTRYRVLTTEDVLNA